MDTEDCLQESPEKKAAWLVDAEKRLPIGSLVRVTSFTDHPPYVGAIGVIVGYNVGATGEWPGFRVKFNKTVDGVEEDIFYADGWDDEIEKL